MSIYSSGGRTQATAPTFQNGVVILWNPHSTKRIWVLEFSWCHANTSSMFAELQRVSTRGTPASTVTPDVDNSWERDVAPPSGAVIDLSIYSVHPTPQTPITHRLRSGGATGLGGMYTLPDTGLCIPPGTGWGLLNGEANTVPVIDVTFIWEERD